MLLRDEWQKLADSTGTDIYLTPDWFAVWQRHFGARGIGITCLVAHQNGVLVGILPFLLERIWVGPLPFRVARLAGTDPHCIIFHLPIEPSIMAEILKKSFNHLLINKGCDAISFTPASELSDLLTEIREASEEDSSVILTDIPDGVHTVFNLPDNFESYIGGLSKKRRGQFRRDQKGLQSKLGMETCVSNPDTEAFDHFVEFHNLQWHAVGKGGHFTDWPGSAAFYRDLVGQTKSNGQLKLYLLKGTEELLATQFSLISRQTCHWRLPARTLNSDAEKLSIGKVGLILMIEKLIAAGITRIEAGRGEYSYKVAYGGEMISVHRLIISPASKVARLRLAVLLKWADLYNLIYYRIWFLKVLPRLRLLTGTSHRPLLRGWIRTRL